MSPKEIPLALQSILQLLETHNALALERGEAQLKSWHASHCTLAQRVAILRTRSIVIGQQAQGVADTSLTHARVKRNMPIRRAMLAALSYIDHYEVAATGKALSKRAAKRHDRRTLLSVGLPYSEVITRIKQKVPNARTTPLALRVAAAAIREGQPGFETTLPQKRPHAAKGRTKCKT